MTWLTFAVAFLFAVALLAYAAAKRLGTRTGIPQGELVYGDTGFPVGKIGRLTRNELGEKQESPLVSRRFGLVGRPDYLVKTAEGIIPVEAKSARCPPSGRPHDSHVMQLAAYCLLVEDVLGAEAPHGIIRYRDGEVAVAYTQELRDELLDVLDEIREARTFTEVHRSHDEPRRCANCYMRDVCDESLQ